MPGHYNTNMGGSQSSYACTCEGSCGEYVTDCWDRDDDGIYESGCSCREDCTTGGSDPHNICCMDFVPKCPKLSGYYQNFPPSHLPDLPVDDQPHHPEHPIQSVSDIWYSVFAGGPEIEPEYQTKPATPVLGTLSISSTCNQTLVYFNPDLQYSGQYMIGGFQFRLGGEVCMEQTCDWNFGECGEIADILDANLNPAVFTGYSFGVAGNQTPDGVYQMIVIPNVDSANTGIPLSNFANTHLLEINHPGDIILSDNSVIATHIGESAAYTCNDCDWDVPPTCQHTIYGCTNPVCPEYDSCAITDDGSCSPIDACGICGGPGPNIQCDDGSFVCDESDCIWDNNCDANTRCSNPQPGANCSCEGGCPPPVAQNYNSSLWCDCDGIFWIGDTGCNAPTFGTGDGGVDTFKGMCVPNYWFCEYDEGMDRHKKNPGPRPRGTVKNNPFAR